MANKVTLKIDGMMCGMCEAHVCDAIRKVCGGKEKVSASHSAGTAEIISDGQLDIARIKAEIKKTGYKVLDVKTEPFEKKKLFGLFGR